MDEKEKKLREDLEFHLDTLRRNLEVVSMEDLKAKYAKPFKELKDNICKTATAYTQYLSLIHILFRTMTEQPRLMASATTFSPCRHGSGAESTRWPLK